MTDLDSTPPAEAGDAAGEQSFTLPAQTSLRTEPTAASASAPGEPQRLQTTWILALAVFGATGASGIAAYQMLRAMNGEERLGALSPVQVVLALFAVVGVVAWTWRVVENARRLLAPGRTTDAPVPRAVAAAWALPLAVGVAAVSSVAFLERRLNTADSDTTSAVPLALALLFLVIAVLVSYRPLFMLSAILRRIGATSGGLARWTWVPISLVAAGALTLVALRSGGGFGENYEGVAPAWALGVVALPPIVILLALSWSGGRHVEDAISFAFDRRTGRNGSGVGRRGIGLYTRILRADARPAVALDTRKRIRIVPGSDILRLSMMIAIAALTLVSIVGALVMFLFWRESIDGTLLPSQRDRAWTSLSGLQTLERFLAVGFVAVATVWSFVNVLNARLASGRRRNPFLAAAAWPAAAYGIWVLSGRLDDAETVADALIAYGLQIAVLYLPFFLLERSAVAVGARRGPLRLTYGIVAALLIHVQGLGGLPTIVEISETDRFGRLAAYLALAALLELIATIAITEASHLIADAAGVAAEKHNFLADQRSQQDDRIRHPTSETVTENFESSRRSSPRPTAGAPVAIAAAATPPPPPPPPPGSAASI